jgi:hypothetical protein
MPPGANMPASSESPTVALGPPFGHGTGDHVSFRHEGVLVPEAVIEILQQYSCWPPAIPKIIECLKHSGRYDCVLQTIWFRAQYSELCRALARVGISVEIFELCSLSKARLR